jgi:hypothetical protein
MLQVLASEVAPALLIVVGQHFSDGTWYISQFIPPQFLRSALFPTVSRPIEHHGIPHAPMWTTSQSGLS